MMQSAMAKTSYLTLRAVMSAWIAEVLTVKETGIALSEVFKPAIYIEHHPIAFTMGRTVS